MKKPMKDRVGDFMAGKGFYIVLFLCVAAIGISGYYLFSTISSDPDPVTPVAGQVRITVTPTPAPTLMPEHSLVSSAPRASQAPVPTAVPRESATAATPAPSAAPEATAPVAALVFTWPVKGEILSPFSVETLAYDVTMGDWRTHAGIDIAAEQGIEIRAAAAGTVTAVTEDPLMGATVVIDHGDGLTSHYANLSSVPSVEIGDSLFTGDIIGTVGDTAIAESALPSHLHFALMKNDLPADPLDYLPGRT